MSKILLIFFIFILCGCQITEHTRVTIIVHTPEILADSEKVYITGNNDLLGNWNPRGKIMGRVDEKSWQTEMHFKSGSKIEYKFTRGSWSTEPVDSEGYVIGNQKLTVNGDTTINYQVENWKDRKHKIKGQITGEVRYHRNLVGKGILPRDIIVWLPPSYKETPLRHYPVLYMHDGPNIIDPRTSYTGIDWQVDETVTRLSHEGKMKEIIIVGIYNSATRNEDYSYTKTGRAYMDFMIKTLKPFIDKTYRTIPDRKNTAVMGSSMGGLISFMLVWFHPEIFSGAACLSPAFIEPYNYAFKWVEDKKAIDKDIKIYIDCGSANVDGRLLQGSRKMVRLLKEKGMKEDKDLKWLYVPEAGHNEANWAKRVWQPLTFLFPAKIKNIE